MGAQQKRVARSHICHLIRKTISVCTSPISYHLQGLLKICDPPSLPRPTESQLGRRCRPSPNSSKQSPLSGGPPARWPELGASSILITCRCPGFLPVCGGGRGTQDQSPQRGAPGGWSGCSHANYHHCHTRDGRQEQRTSTEALPVLSALCFNSLSLPVTLSCGFCWFHQPHFPAGKTEALSG